MKWIEHRLSPGSQSDHNDMALLSTVYYNLREEWVEQCILERYVNLELGVYPCFKKKNGIFKHRVKNSR